MDYGETRVVQVTNIAPQATRDQMSTLFSHIGKIEDLRLYPSLRDASVTIQARVCFIKFMEEATIPVSLHMTNTVFIDRAIIVQPFMDNDLPDEISGLEFANSSQRGREGGENRLPPHVTNVEEGGVLLTQDERLASTGLPPFPPLQRGLDERAVEEIRRTVVVLGIGPTTTAQEVMDYFATAAGEVKYFRWCSRDAGGEGRMALVEFTDYGAIIPAMRLNNTMVGEHTVQVYYSSQAITKPQAKSNEAALKEIEEAMKKVKEAQSLVSATVDPLMGMLGVKPKESRSRSRSRPRYDHRDHRGPYRGPARSRSRSRDRYSRRRSRSRDRRRRSRSRDRRRSRSKRRSRTRSRDRRRDSDRKKEEKVKEESVTETNGETEIGKSENGAVTNGEGNGTADVKKEKKSRSRSRKRSRSRSRKRSKRSRSRRRRSRSRSRRRSRSRERRRSRSREHKHKKSKHGRKSRERDEVKKEITRDYDREEAGYENTKKEEKDEVVDMEISNSP